MQTSHELRKVLTAATRAMKVPPRPDWGMAQRMVADAILVNAALIIAFTVRFFALVWFFGDDTLSEAEFYSRTLQSSVGGYLASALPLSGICLAVFYASGFYTHGRAYRGRYKALIMFQAVTLAYVIFAVLHYLIVGAQTWFPRTVWVTGWLLTVVVVSGVRIAAKIWRITVWKEAKLNGRPPKKHIEDVLVIGGAGYVGSVLIGKLLDKGYHVTVMDALVYGDDGVRQYYGRRGFDVVQGDLRDIETIIRSLRYADAVIHLGGLVGDPACDLDEKLTGEINLASTRLIGEAARGFGIQRFIFASSCSVYGASDELLTERSRLDPVSLYAKTKKDSEKVLLDLEDLNFAPIILRFGTFYGLSPRPRFDLVVNLLAAKAVREKEITIFGGEQWRPFIHVEDGAAAIMRCMEAPLHAVKGEIFNVGSDHNNYTIKQVGELVRELVPDATVALEPAEASEANYRVSFAKIRRYLNFEPTRTVGDGIREIRDALSNGLIPEYQSAVYSNHKRLAEGNGNGDLDLRRKEISPLYSIHLTDETVSAGS
ncbi:MAG: NAD-dependent epimerase/dehydratase family protein [Actinomycetota bacterium]